MAKHWRIHPHDPARILALERSAAVPAVVAQLLFCRGIHDPERARNFLEPRLTELRDPEQLPGLSVAADHITAAVAAGRRIVVYGDYDVDGMSGTAILYLCLKLLGAQVSYYVPNRIDEGYGLNCEALASLARAARANGHHRRLRRLECRRSRGGTPPGSRVDRHRSSPFTGRAARGRRDRSSGPARQQLSVYRAVRRGRRLQAGLGLVPTRQPIEEGRPADARVSDAGHRARVARHGGRRRAAGGRESRAGAARSRQPPAAPAVGHFGADETGGSRHSQPAVERGHCLQASPPAQRGRSPGSGHVGRRAADHRFD